SWPSSASTPWTAFGGLRARSRRSRTTRTDAKGRPILRGVPSFVFAALRLPPTRNAKARDLQLALSEVAMKRRFLSGSYLVIMASVLAFGSAPVNSAAAARRDVPGPTYMSAEVVRVDADA